MSEIDINILWERYNTYFKMFFAMVFVILMFNSFVQSLLFDIGSFIYLVYKSITIIECDDEIRKMLKWWISYGVNMILRTIMDYIIYFIGFISLYNVIKICFYLWILTDPHNRLEYCYNKIISVYENNKCMIDDIYNCINGIVNCYILKINKQIISIRTHFLTYIKTKMEDI